MEILVTGGAGYIGSHTLVELINAGFKPVVIDNFCNSHPETLKRVEQICSQPVPYYRMDLSDKVGLRNVMFKHDFSAVMHFAGLKAVGESCQQPLKYYSNNVVASIILAEVMEEFSLRRIIFSSSATVYGDPERSPISENSPTQTTSPYGASKLMVESVFTDVCRSNEQWSCCLLRYFNPIGAHHSGAIGENPKGIPNNLLPYVSQVAVGKLSNLVVFGDDYDTRDGTGVRDYIHVVDVAKGHVAALRYLLQQPPERYVFNLGTGCGHTVLEVVSAFESASGIEIPYTVSGRRDGDVAECYADVSLVRQVLGWKAELDLHAMVTDTWRWQSKNPDGYN